MNPAREKGFAMRPWPPWPSKAAIFGFAVTKMTMQSALYYYAVCHMDEVRQLPRAMRGVRLTSIDAPEPFADGPLGTTNLYVIAIWRDKNINKPPRHTVAPALNLAAHATA